MRTQAAKAVGISVARMATACFEQHWAEGKQEVVLESHALVGEIASK